MVLAPIQVPNHDDDDFHDNGDVKNIDSRSRDVGALRHVFVLQMCFGCATHCSVQLLQCLLN